MQRIGRADSVNTRKINIKCKRYNARDRFARSRVLSTACRRSRLNFIAAPSAPSTADMYPTDCYICKGGWGRKEGWVEAELDERSPLKSGNGRRATNCPDDWPRAGGARGWHRPRGHRQASTSSRPFPDLSVFRLVNFDTLGHNRSPQRHNLPPRKKNR